MKLIKITDSHYVIVDDSEIEEGDWIYNAEREPSILKCVGKGSLRGWQKITHSTDIDINELYYISLKEVKELLGEVDVKKKAELYVWGGVYLTEQEKQQTEIAYMTGYNQALEDNKGKKYTEEDVRKAIAVGFDWCHQKLIPQDWMINNYIQQLQQPKIEWDVEFDSQYKLKLI